MNANDRERSLSYNDTFVGRNKVFEAVKDLWQIPPKTPRSMLLWGDITNGKSSTLFSIEKKIPDTDVAHLNLLRIFEREHKYFWLMLADSVRNATKVSPNQEFLLNPSYSLFWQYVDGVVRQRRPNRKMLLAIDDYETLKAFPEAESILHQLSSLTLANRDIAFILCGTSEIDQLYFKTFKTTATVKLGFLTKKETAELIDIQPPIFDSLVIERIYELTHGQPYLVKWLCVELVSENKWNVIENDVSVPVQYANLCKIVESPEFYVRYRYYFTGIWDRLSSREAIIMKLLASYSRGLALNEIVKKTEIESSEAVSICIGLLTVYNWIKKVDDRYYVTVELFRRWILQTQF